jgi:TRAP-type C4-dicarboxylate transport system permease small subunit
MVEYLISRAGDILSEYGFNWWHFFGTMLIFLCYSQYKILTPVWMLFWLIAFRLNLWWIYLIIYFGFIVKYRRHVKQSYREGINLETNFLMNRMVIYAYISLPLLNKIF